VVGEGGELMDRFEIPHSKSGPDKPVDRLRGHEVARVAMERGEGPPGRSTIGRVEINVPSPQQVKAPRLPYDTAGNKDDRYAPTRSPTYRSVEGRSWLDTGAAPVTQ